MGWRSAITAGIAALGCAACGVGGLPGDDGSGADAGPTPDGGGEPTHGVTVELVSLGPNGQPAAGGAPLEFDTFTVESITIQFHDLRLIGDTAPSGDLVHDSRALEFPTAPQMRVSFEDAPPGLYSRFNFDVERSWAEEPLPEGFEGERLSVRVVGEAHLGNKDRSFVYRDDRKLEVDLGLDEEVAPGVPGSVVVELDVQKWFMDVPWDDLDGRGGGNQPIRIGMGDNEDVADLLRGRMPSSFEVRE